MSAVSLLRRTLVIAVIGVLFGCTPAVGNRTAPSLPQDQVTTLQLTAADPTFATAPLVVRRAWKLPTPGHVTGLQHQDNGSLVVMGLIGDPRSAVSPPAEPDRAGILDLDTGILRVVPSVERDRTVAAWTAGPWLITRESAVPLTGCVATSDDCESWKLYKQPLDLRSGPALIASSVVPGPIIDEAAPASDGKVLVWQSLNADGTFSLDETSLDRLGKPRTLSTSPGPAIQLALDGLGNVLVDVPTNSGSANTGLVQVSISNGASSGLPVHNAHYPSIRHQELLDVTGNGGQLTDGQVRQYPLAPNPAGQQPRLVFRSGDLYDLQFLTDKLAIAIDSDGITVVDLETLHSSHLAVRPIARGRVSGSGNALTMLVATAGPTEAIIEAYPT